MCAVMNDGNGNDTSWVERSIIGGIPGQFLEKSTSTFVPDSPAMYLGNDEGGKIRLRPKLNNPYPMLGGTINYEILVGTSLAARFSIRPV